MSAQERHWIKRSFKGLAFALLLAAALGFTYEEIGRWQDSQHRFRIGKAVDVGGRSLNVECSGSGLPTVVLESGGGGYGGYGWRAVQEGIAKFTQVCWYDRAGEGWSDPAPSARTSSFVVNDLHELLKRASIEGPYVLVGHSIGGEYVRIFTARFPDEVAGVVLVDSTHPEQQEPSFMRSPVNRLPKLAREFLCSAMPLAQRLGMIRLLMRNSPVDVPLQFQSEQASATLALRNQRVKGIETEVTQGCAATEGGAERPDRGSGNPEVDRAAENSGELGDRPLIVLTAGQYWRPSDPVAAGEIAKFHESWVHQLQPELSHLSTRGQQIIVESSDHSIPEHAPEAIVTAVSQVVMAIREPKNQQKK
jgi:pimeloyl-ACP methyl ester carboxylesterase